MPNYGQIPNGNNIKDDEKENNGSNTGAEVVVIWAIDQHGYHRYQKEHSKSNEVEGDEGCENARKRDEKPLPNLREDPDHVLERNVACCVDAGDGVDDGGGGEEGEDE